MRAGVCGDYVQSLIHDITDLFGKYKYKYKYKYIYIYIYSCPLIRDRNNLSIFNDAVYLVRTMLLCSPPFSQANFLK